MPVSVAFITSEPLTFAEIALPVVAVFVNEPPVPVALFTVPITPVVVPLPLEIPLMAKKPALLVFKLAQLPLIAPTPPPTVRPFEFTVRLSVPLDFTFTVPDDDE